MKRYLLFMGEEYYPNGGQNDYAGSSRDENKLIKFFNKRTKKGGIDWGHIVDTEISRVVWSSQVSDFEHPPSRSHDKYVHDLRTKKS